MTLPTTFADVVLAARAPAAAESPWGVLIAVALIGFVLCALLSERARTARAHKRLHGELAVANGLTAAEARLLWRLAVRARLAEPALVYVRPSVLDASPGAAKAKVDAELVRAIRAKLFGA